MQDKQPLEKLFDEREIADITGIKQRRIQELRHKGGGPNFVKIGRSVRYRLSDVEAWLQKQTYQHTSQVDAIAG